MLNMPMLVFETDINPLQPGDENGGWVSGSIKNLAIAGTSSVIFDLGEHWNQFQFIQISIDPGNSTSTGIIMSCASSMYISTGFLRHGLAGTTGGASTSYVGPLNASSGPQCSKQNHQGRFIQITVSGIATAALGATAKIRLSAHP